MYFHTDSIQTIVWLANVLGTAHDTETRIRLDVDAKGNLRIKRGEGMWSPPLASTPDPYRELEVSNELAVDAENVQPGDLLTAFGNAPVRWVVPNSEFFTRVGFDIPCNDGVTRTTHVVLSNCATVSVRRAV